MTSEVKTCVVIGAGPSGIAELQARLAVGVATGRHVLPGFDEMRRDVRETDPWLRRQFPLDHPARSALVEHVQYLLDLAGTLGVEPDLRRLLVQEPRAWYRVVFGPLHCAQLRLTGSRAEARAARARLRELPVMPVDQVPWSTATIPITRLLHRVGLLDHGTLGV